MEGPAFPQRGKHKFLIGNFQNRKEGKSPTYSVFFTEELLKFDGVCSPVWNETIDRHLETILLLFKTISAIRGVRFIRSGTWFPGLESVALSVDQSLHLGASRFSVYVCFQVYYRWTWQWLNTPSSPHVNYCSSFLTVPPASGFAFLQSTSQMANHVI